ncbi:MAG: hypothetical protein JF599_01430 [Verrucomicrobia bacterium]|nr:hypothetical protein [Verrucomicrobiota bacterium]
MTMRSKVACHYCGLPFSAVRVQPGRDYFCCSGCAIASRVPVDAQGRFPVNPTLLAALGLGFVLFNELLCWLFAVLLVREGRTEVAVRLVMGSLALGVASWGALVVVQWRAGARRWVDVSVVGLLGGVLVAGLQTRSPACVVAGNLALVAWSLRGFLKQKTPGKPADGG